MISALNERMGPPNGDLMEKESAMAGEKIYIHCANNHLVKSIWHGEHFSCPGYRYQGYHALNYRCASCKNRKARELLSVDEIAQRFGITLNPLNDREIHYYTTPASH